MGCVDGASDGPEECITEGMNDGKELGAFEGASEI